MWLDTNLNIQGKADMNRVVLRMGILVLILGLHCSDNVTYDLLLIVSQWIDTSVPYAF